MMEEREASKERVRQYQEREREKAKWAALSSEPPLPKVVQPKASRDPVVYIVLGIAGVIFGIIALGLIISDKQQPTATTISTPTTTMPQSTVLEGLTPEQVKKLEAKRDLIPVNETGTIQAGPTSPTTAPLPKGTTKAAAQPIEKGQSICYEIQNYVNALVDYTRTSCVPAAGEGALSFIVISSEPVFSVEASKKAWLLVVVAAVGKLMNDQPAVKIDKLFVSDANLMKGRVAYSFPATLTRSLQSKVFNGEMQVETMYAQIGKNLVRKDIPGQRAGMSAEAKPTAPAAPRDPDDLMLRLGACSKAQEAVRAALKAPSSAEFPSCGWSMSEYEIRGNDDRSQFSVTGYVDAQNSFGAKLRNKFVVLLKKQATGMATTGWTVTKVAVGG
jgi:hypothetical protein